MMIITVTFKDVNYLFYLKHDCDFHKNAGAT